jgi:gliding motility-associated-like protein
VQAAAVDSFGCDLLSNVLTFSFDPSPPAPSFVFDPPCFGDPLELSVSDPFTVTWLSGLNGDPIFTGSTVSVDSLVADTVFYAQLTSALCPGPPAGVAISPKPLPGAPISATDAPVCTGTAFTLSVLNPELGVVYNWFSNIGSFGAGVDVQVFAESMALAGNYSVVGNLDGCRGDTSTVEVELIRTRQVSLRPDTALCLQSELILKADTIFVDYLWQDGSTATEYIPEESGIYFLQVTDFNGCKSQALVNIELVDCSITFPNIFTPNGDGINDLWLLSVSKPLFFKVLVYNRWGNLVYESFSVGNWWDGNHFQTGEPCSEGVYFYIAEINSFESVSYSLTGNVTLMRENRP